LQAGSAVLALHGTAMMRCCMQDGGAHWFSSGDGREVIILQDVVAASV